MNKDYNYTIERLTSGPKHHLFGFHDLLITNKTGNKYLSLEVDIINRPPLPGELFGVGYVLDNRYIRIGETTAFNYPQGARQQWVAGSELFVANNRVENVWGTDLYDTTNNQLIDRFEASTHMLSKDGRFSFGLDYSRLFRLGGYGYSGIPDVSELEAAPTSSGITIQDLHTKEIRLLVSVMEVAQCGTSFSPNNSFHHYLTHLTLNPSSTRLAFLHRYFMPDGGMMTRLMTIGTDGKGLRCLAQGFLSHFDWRDDSTIYIFGRANSNLDALRANPIFSNKLLAGPIKIAKHCVKTVMKRKATTLGKSFLLINDTELPNVRSFAQGIITEDGHPMTCPIDNDWCVNDTYPDENGIRTLMLYNFSKNIRLNLGTFRMLNQEPDMLESSKYFVGVDSKILKSISPKQLSFTRSGLHCDLHPRWSFDGKQVLFDSIHEGSRQIYALDTINIISPKDD